MAQRFLIDDELTWGYFNTQCGTGPNIPNTHPMGLGLLANPGLVFKRKFRWTLAIQYCIGSAEPGVDDPNIKTVPEEFVKTASRPQIDIDETEINYLNGKFWIPGKATYQAMNVAYYDVAGTATGAPSSCDDTTADPSLACYPCYNDELSAYTPPVGNTFPLFGWLASVYNFTDPCRLQMGSKTGDYQGEGLLRLYDGCGQTVEAWIMGQMFPTSINFGELDMSDSEVCTVELTLRYGSLQYQLLCPFTTISRCPCSPCATCA